MGVKGPESALSLMRGPPARVWVLPGSACSYRRDHDHPPSCPLQDLPPRVSSPAQLAQLTSLCWNSLVTPKNSVVASCVENVSPTKSRYISCVRMIRHFLGLMGVSLKTRAPWMTVCSTEQGQRELRAQGDLPREMRALVASS